MWITCGNRVEKTAFLWINHNLTHLCETNAHKIRFNKSFNKKSYIKNNYHNLNMLKKLKKYKLLAIFFVVLLLLSVAFNGIVVASANKYNGVTIVLDAGHGGRDGGSVGANGTIEKELNLSYTLMLKEKLVKAGYRVELTRKNDDGLYSNLAKNKKISDMNARFEIIKKTNPNLVISIHMNSFADKTAYGANTYYRVNDEASKNVANIIQASLNNFCGAKTKFALVGDYYILNCSYYTSVLIECGFISNPEEEQKLNSQNYKQNFTDAIAKAIFIYFGKRTV